MMMPARRLCFQVLLAGTLLSTIGTSAFAHGHPQAGTRAPDAVFLSGGRRISLVAYHGKKVMLWLFSTWCPSCRAGLETLPHDQKRFLAGHLHLIILENYKNGGYPGPSLKKMKNRYAKGIQGASNWSFGHATRSLASLYNPQSYPDIFYLIRRDGTIRTVESAPTAHLATILHFAEGSGS
jgi:thiol-disulfide isomerase/thioredoxin